MNKKTWTGVLIAPLIAPVLYQLGLILFEYSPVADISTLFTQAFIPLLVVALPVSYGAMVFIGLPVVWLLHRIHFLNFLSVTICAAISGLLIMSYIYGLSSWKNAEWEVILWYPVFGSILGFSVAAVYCLITGITNLSIRQDKQASKQSKAF